MDHSLPQLLDERETASVLGCSIASLRRWRHENRGLRFVKIERCVRYRDDEIRRFLEQNSSDNKKAADRESAAQREVRSAHATTRNT